jgi:hypothetical protein
MKKITTPLLALAIIAAIGLNSLAAGQSIGYSVNEGDEFYYEFTYARNSLAIQTVETERHVTTKGMVKVSILDIDVNLKDGNASITGLVSERIWYRTLNTGYELIASQKVFPINVKSVSSHNITTFGSTAIIDGMVNKDIISSFIQEAPIFIPTGLNKSYIDSMFILFTGQLAVAYDGATINTYTVDGTTCVVNPLQPSGYYSDYKIEISYDANGMLAYYRVLSLVNAAHIIFTFERVDLDSNVEGKAEGEIAGFPLGIIALISITSILIIKRKAYKL